MTTGGDTGEDTGGDTGGEVEVRRAQPYEARKVYLCPGCNQDIAVGLGHLVVVCLLYTSPSPRDS